MDVPEPIPVRSMPEGHERELTSLHQKAEESLKAQQYESAVKHIRAMANLSRRYDPLETANHWVDTAGIYKWQAEELPTGTNERERLLAERERLKLKYKEAQAYSLAADWAARSESEFPEERRYSRVASQLFASGVVACQRLHERAKETGIGEKELGGIDLLSKRFRRTAAKESKRHKESMGRVCGREISLDYGGRIYRRRNLRRIGPGLSYDFKNTGFDLRITEASHARRHLR